MKVQHPNVVAMNAVDNGSMFRSEIRRIRRMISTAERSERRTPKYASVVKNGAIIRLKSDLWKMKISYLID
jgi:hypothetical protein